MFPKACEGSSPSTFQPAGHEGAEVRVEFRGFPARAAQLPPVQVERNGDIVVIVNPAIRPSLGEVCGLAKAVESGAHEKEECSI